MRRDVGPEPRRKAVLEGLAASRITCSSTEALQFKDRYRIHRGAETATIDIFYDGSQRITGVESADASGATRLLLDAIECVEGLPGYILRPRFVDRIASPVLLIEAHTQALQEIDIDIVGLRLAQFQLRYDLIDRYDPTSATFQVSVHYDRRGRVTYRAAAVGQEVPNRVLQAFSDNRGDESTETDAVTTSSPEAKRAEAKSLRESGQYQLSADLYESLWTDDAVRESWDGWGLAHCLRKLNRPRDAARICKQVEEFDRDFLPIWNLHGWSLYSAYLADPAGTSAESLLDVLDGVAKCANQGDPYGQYSPLTRSAFNVLKALRSSDAQPGQILKTLEYLDPERLSGVPETIQTGRRTVRIPSLKERYYHSKTRALFDLELWEECANECVRAIESDIQFRGQGRDWIQRRLALALLNMGDHAGASALIRGAKTRLDGWFLWDDLAQVEVARGDLEAARDHLRGALRAAGPIEMKLSALRRMAQICEQLDDKADACAHAALAQAVRLERGWSLDQDLNALVGRLGCESTPADVAELLAAVSASWRSRDDRRTGVITNILPNGKAGFIEPDEGGADRYFKLADSASSRPVMAGDRVSYVETQGFDRKTGRTALNASDIELTEEH